MIKRRDFIKNTLLLSSNLALTSLPLVSFTTPKINLNKEITIGIFSPSHCAAPLIFAEKKGYFKDEGLSVKLINYPTMTALARDLVSGSIDLGQLTVPLIFAIHTGANPSKLHENLDMSMVLGVHGSNLMVNKDSKIIRPIDFKG